MSVKFPAKQEGRIDGEGGGGNRLTGSEAGETGVGRDEVIPTLERKVQKLGCQNGRDGVRALRRDIYHISTCETGTLLTSRVALSHVHSPKSDGPVSNNVRMNAWEGERSKKQREKPAPVLQYPSLNMIKERAVRGAIKPGWSPQWASYETHLKNPVIGEVLHCASRVPNTFTGRAIDMMVEMTTIVSIAMQLS
jgi:hypothetical protein